MKLPKSKKPPKSKKRNNKVYYIYQLKLARGKYYVGSTTSPKHRLEQHICGSKLGAAWTRKYKPVKLMHCRAIRACKGKTVSGVTARRAEDRTTRRLMKKHGLSMVRGGGYTQVKLPLTTRRGLQSYISKGKRLNAHCRKIESWHQANRCTRCGSRSHWASKCKK